MGRLCFGLTRTFLIVENFVVVTLASLLIYISVSAMDQDFGMDLLNDSHPKVVHTYISAICAGVGIIIALVSVLGLFGSIRKSESALAMYTAIVLFMLIVLSVLVVITITMQNNGKSVAYKDLDKSVVNATINIYNYENLQDFRTRALDQIQKQLSCCGINSPNDWKDFGHIRKVPKSCCSIHVETSQPALFKYCEQSEFKIGCWRAMTDHFHSNIASVRTSLYVLIGFSFVCSLASISMIRTLRRRSEVV
jgi:CD63 antigen